MRYIPCAAEPGEFGEFEGAGGGVDLGLDAGGLGGSEVRAWGGEGAGDGGGGGCGGVWGGGG